VIECGSVGEEIREIINKRKRKMRKNERKSQRVEIDQNLRFQKG